MDFTIIHDDKVNRFEVLESGQIAYLQYTETNYILDIKTIFVPPQLEGLGVSTSLIVEAMRYAVKKHLRIKATAPFAIEYFSRHPQYDRLLVENK